MKRIAKREVIVLVRVKKRSEEFDKAKLKKSMKKAGAKEGHARKVANKIAGKVKEGTRTVEIWRWVIAELRPLDPKAAEAYRTYRSKMKKKPKR
jgi:transcriptional regulator NrdR family protein